MLRSLCVSIVIENRTSQYGSSGEQQRWVRHALGFGVCRRAPAVDVSSPCNCRKLLALCGMPVAGYGQFVNYHLSHLLLLPTLLSQGSAWDHESRVLFGHRKHLHVLQRRSQ